MASKREERKERADITRQQAERRQRQRKVGARLLMILGAFAVLAVAVLAARRPASGDGRVWSVEHGHWHDR